MRPIWRRTLSVLLTLAMVFGMAGMTSALAAAPGSAGTITGFAGCETQKEVARGAAADIAALDLPETLTATVETAADSGAPNSGALSLPVTWMGGFDGGTVGTYPLTAAWDPAYALGQDVTAPVITVTVTPEQDNGGLVQTVTAFPGFDGASPLDTLTVEEKTTVAAIGLPETVTATMDGGDAEVPVTWEYADDYEATAYETYDFNAVLGEGYQLADGLAESDLPYITVEIAGMKDPNAKNGENLFQITPNAAPNYFAPAQVGYDNTKVTLTFTVSNIGTGTATNLTASFTGTNSDKFEIGTALSATELAPGASATVSIRPVTGLGAGTYADAALKFAADNGVAEQTSLSFSVYAAGAIDVGTADALKTALASTEDSKFQINVTADIKLTGSAAQMSGDHLLSIPAGKTVTVTAGGVNLGNHSLTINGGGTFVCAKESGNALFDDTGALNLESIAVNVTGGGGIEVNTINVNSGATVTIDTATTNFSLKGAVSVAADGKIDVQDTASRYGSYNGAILINGGQSLSLTGALAMKQLGGAACGVYVASGGTLSLASGSAFAGCKPGSAIYLVAGSCVFGMSNKLSDQGQPFTTDGRVTVGAKTATAAENQLTEGLYVWDGSKFARTGGNLGADGALFIAANAAVTDNYETQGWKWENNILTLKDINGNAADLVKCVNIKTDSAATIKLESDVTLAGAAGSSQVGNSFYLETLNSTQDLTIDAAGHTLTATAVLDGCAINSGGALSITGGHVQATKASAATQAILVTGALTISGGADVTVTATGGAMAVSAGGGVTVRESSALVASANSSLHALRSNNGDITIDHSTVTASNTGSGPALNKAPILTNVTATAGTDATGTGAGAYDAGNIANYKYLKTEPSGATPGTPGADGKPGTGDSITNAKNYLMVLGGGGGGGGNGADAGNRAYGGNYQTSFDGTKSGMGGWGGVGDGTTGGAGGGGGGAAVSGTVTNDQKRLAAGNTPGSGTDGAGHTTALGGKGGTAATSATGGKGGDGGGATVTGANDTLAGIAVCGGNAGNDGEGAAGGKGGDGGDVSLTLTPSGGTLTVSGVVTAQGGYLLNNSAGGQGGTATLTINGDLTVTGDNLLSVNSARFGGNAALTVTGAVTAKSINLIDADNNLTVEIPTIRLGDAATSIGLEQFTVPEIQGSTNGKVNFQFSGSGGLEVSNTGTSASTDIPMGGVTFTFDHDYSATTPVVTAIISNQSLSGTVNIAGSDNLGADFTGWELVKAGGNQTLAKDVTTIDLTGATALNAVYPAPSAAATLAGGAGTELDPYEISTPGQLLLLAKLINEGKDATVTSGGASVAYDDLQKAYYKLTANVNMGGAPWTPIGLGSDNLRATDKAFMGHFDGQGHTVSGISFDDTTDAFWNGATGGDCVGLFGGAGDGSEIKGVHVEGSLSGANRIGGVVGYTLGAVVACSSAATVRGSGSYVGGVVGRIVPLRGVTEANQLTACYNTGTVSGDNNVGGVVGRAGVPVTGCYNTGAVSGTGNAGGIAGYLTGTTLSNCVSLGQTVTGSAQGSRRVATGDNSTFTNNYARKDLLVNGATVAGEAAGRNGADLTNFTTTTTTPAMNTIFGAAFDTWWQSNSNGLPTLKGETVTAPGIPTEPAAYTVSFNANGGGGTMAAVPNISGSYTLPASAFTAPVGKQFKTWAAPPWRRAPPTPSAPRPRSTPFGRIFPPAAAPAPPAAAAAPPAEAPAAPTPTPAPAAAPPRPRAA